MQRDYVNVLLRSLKDAEVVSLATIGNYGPVSDD